MKRLLPLFFPICLFSQPAWINEFHYDNVGADTLEFVEVVVDLSDSILLSEIRFDIYNGLNGKTNFNQTLDQWVPGDTLGNFALFHQLISIQNGPEGFALSDSASLFEFICFEDSFAAVDGPALGHMGELVPVEEGNSTPSGMSLSRSGYGDSTVFFTWGATIATPGSENQYQTLTPCSSPSAPIINMVYETGSGLQFEFDTARCFTDFLIIGSTAGYQSISSLSSATFSSYPIWSGSGLNNSPVQVFFQTNSLEAAIDSLPEDSLLYFTVYGVFDSLLSQPVQYSQTFENRASKLYLTEVMYNPLGGLLNEKDREWIELYNSSEDTVDLTGWGLSSGDEISWLTSPFASIPPKHFLTLGTSTDTTANLGAPVDIQLDPSFRLSNTQDSVCLVSPDGKVVFCFYFGSYYGLSTSDHYSIERLSINAPLYDTANWKESNRYGGTPGAAQNEFRYTRNRWYPENPNGNIIDTLWIGSSVSFDSLFCHQLTVYYDTLTLQPKGLLDADSTYINGCVNFSSDSTGYAQASGKNHCSASGAVIWQYYFLNPGWRLLSCPLRNADFSSFEGSILLNYQGNPLGENLKRWDSNKGTWEGVKNANSTADSCGFLLYLDPNFTLGKSFPVQAHLQGKGWKNHFDTLNTHYNSGPQWGGSFAGQQVEGWALWHNPFPRQLKWSELYNTQSQYLSPAYYAWSSQEDGWEFHNGLIGTQNVSDFIAPGQAFFVRLIDSTIQSVAYDSSMTSLDTLQMVQKSNPYSVLKMDSLGLRTEFLFLLDKPNKTVQFNHSSDVCSPSNEWSMLLQNGLDSIACVMMGLDLKDPSLVPIRKRTFQNWTVELMPLSSLPKVTIECSDSTFELNNNEGPKALPSTFLSVRVHNKPIGIPEVDFPNGLVGYSKGYWIALDNFKKITVYSVAGQKVQTYHSVLPGDKIDVDGPPGLYTLTLETEKGRITVKKVIKN